MTITFIRKPKTEQVSPPTEQVDCTSSLPYKLVLGDCLDILKGMPDNYVDSIVTDPPAGIGFMNKEWDHHKGGRDYWIGWVKLIAAECLRVIKPGGHALVWSLPRTEHWTATAWEDGGWEVRDKVVHIFGTGFPKSLNIGKSLDKSAGAVREVVGIDQSAVRVNSERNHVSGQVAALGLKGAGSGVITAPATDDAKKWDGWGTALKPAYESWVLLRKPLEGTVAANTLKHGVGGINIDACRVPTEDGLSGGRNSGSCKASNDGWNRPYMQDAAYLANMAEESKQRTEKAECLGRFPANITHDGSEEVLEVFPSTVSKSSGGSGEKSMGALGKNVLGSYALDRLGDNAGGLGDSGTPARFFYCPKASSKDRNEGCDALDLHEAKDTYGDGLSSATKVRTAEQEVNGVSRDMRHNHHPTVKNVELMKYLCRLITPPSGLLLDPFMGSGSTLKAALLEGFRCVGIEKEAEYMAIAEKRCEHAHKASEHFNCK